ncbi:MAG: hypothetical protein K2X47_04685 [Bdellovibrionales bacterium]|nr:hypothetical protein [Bdellovibrionales bacterium]
MIPSTLRVWHHLEILSREPLLCGEKIRDHGMMETAHIAKAGPGLGPALVRLGQAARSSDRTADLNHFRGLQRSTKVAETMGRLILHFGSGPALWGLGMGLIAYYFAVEAQLVEFPPMCTSEFPS